MDGLNYQLLLPFPSKHFTITFAAKFKNTDVSHNH